MTLLWRLCCRHATAHAHSGAQRARTRAPPAGLRLWLHSGSRLHPAATAQLWLRHVKTEEPLNLPDSPHHHHHHLSTRLDSFLPSVFFFVFLTSVPWSSTHNRGHKQATAHFDFECYICFIIIIIMIKVIIILLLSKKTFICIKGLLFVFY